MPSHFFTNRDDNTLYKKFEGTFAANPEISHFDALVGYLRASGYFRIRPLIEHVPHIRILLGINVDKLLGNAQAAGLEFFGNHGKTKEEFLSDVLADIQRAEYKREIEQGILQFIEDIVEGKLSVKAHPTKKIHAKVYLFYRDIHSAYDKQRSVITGSSNLTDAGLGTGNQFNYEFNVELDGYDDVKFAYDEFEELWKEAVDVLPVDAQQLKLRSYLRDDFTPFELYIKMLIEYFGNRVEYDPYNIELLLPDKYTRLKYQTDAANQGYAMMRKHNGFILADVVGLGKTIVAAMILKKFIYENGTQTRILVVCPPAIEEGWVRTAEDFQIRPHLAFITTGSLHKVLDRNHYEVPDAEQFDLVVVDESHQFRNQATDRYVALQEICKTPRLRPGEHGDTRKKVVLVSATPLNNRPEDIENQLYLFQDRRNSTLDGVRNLQEYFKPLNEKYRKLASEKKLNIPKLKALFNQLRNDVVEPLVIRRTRKDIENNADYLADLKAQGIKFPKVGDPVALEYELDATLSKLFFDSIEIIAGDEDGQPLPHSLEYYRYRAIEFLVNDDDRNAYGNVESISRRLAHIMRLLLVKRLESSFHAFKSSLKRFQRATNHLIAMLEADRVFVAPDLNVNALLDDNVGYDKILEKVEARGGNNREFPASAFHPEFLERLRGDKQKLDALAARWEKVHHDPKLNEFIRAIRERFFDPKHNVSGKLVIFTESTETAEEIRHCLAETLKMTNVLTVSSETRKELGRAIRYNFDANLPEAEWQNDYDVVVTTEVLAEGVNLHRANVIVNYDTPWNATRLMQRIGRVNRIGSRADRVFVYNFYPSAEGDTEIRLVDNALRKLQAFHTAFGEDNRIFSLLEEVGDGGMGGRKIKEEESEILTYLNFLREFRKTHPKEYRAIAAIPDKARVGRDSVRVPADDVPAVDESGLQPHLPGASLCYLKADNHPGVFCLVTAPGNSYPLSFLEAVRLFRADPDEGRVDLPPGHFDAVGGAFEFFRSDVVQKAIGTVTSKNLSNVENKAVTNLQFALKLAPTPQKREVIKAALDQIKAGKFPSKGLPAELVGFFNAHQKRLATDIDGFFNDLFVTLLNRYNFTAAETADNKPPTVILNPKIVLTASFQ